MEEVEWNRRKTTKLIELYRSYELLWNPTNEEYKVKNSRHDALRAIGEMLNIDKSEVERKIKNLSGQFSREVKRTHKLGGRAGQPVSRWSYYKHMLFLKDKNSPYPSPSITKETYEQSFEAEDQESSASVNTSELVDALPEIEIERTNYDGQKATVPTYVGRGQKRKCERIENQRVDEAYRILKESENRDSCHVYGEYVGGEIRNFLPKTQVVVKHLINNILFEAAMGKYDSDESGQFDSSKSTVPLLEGASNASICSGSSPPLNFE